MRVLPFRLLGKGTFFLWVWVSPACDRPDGVVDEPKEPEPFGDGRGRIAPLGLKRCMVPLQKQTEV